MGCLISPKRDTTFCLARRHFQQGLGHNAVGWEAQQGLQFLVFRAPTREYQPRNDRGSAKPPWFA
jgi:hypothetical protein